MDSEAFQSTGDVLDLNFQCELGRGRGLQGKVLWAGAGPGLEVSVLIATPSCPALAMKHMDLKQMELDTAAAKVDELTKQLESLWSDSPTPPGSQAGAPPRVSLRALVPTLAPKASFFCLSSVSAAGQDCEGCGLFKDTGCVGTGGSGHPTGPTEGK